MPEFSVNRIIIIFQTPLFPTVRPPTPAGVFIMASGVAAAILFTHPLPPIRSVILLPRPITELPWAVRQVMPPPSLPTISSQTSQLPQPAQFRRARGVSYQEVAVS